MRKGVSSRKEFYSQAPESCGEGRLAHSKSIDQTWRELTRLLQATKYAFFAGYFWTLISWIAISRRLYREYKKCTTTNMCTEKRYPLRKLWNLDPPRAFVSHASVQGLINLEGHYTCIEIDLSCLILYFVISFILFFDISIK